jgi:uncharacterized heparinase superfamily protein
MFIQKLKRILRKPPSYIIFRIIHELSSYFDKYFSPARAKKYKLNYILKKLGDHTLHDLWNRLSLGPYATLTSSIDIKLIENEIDVERIFYLADCALQNKINIFGSGLISLGANIDWLKDYKSGFSWKIEYCKKIDYINLSRASDVKFPWEVSRLQWIIPLGQAYLLTKNDSYAAKVKNILIDWIESNPYAYSVNWSCTMEVALRIIIWTWLFKVFSKSESWQCQLFQEKFICSLYLHGEFTERYIEKSDINGNHYTADAVGLLFAGLFFDSGEDAERWKISAWNILLQEIEIQVTSDGVDFEGSVPYHRLVQELFLYGALYWKAKGLSVPKTYRDQLVRMAKFTDAYSRNDGSIPLLGDADDARVLPFGSQGLNDHRYIIGAVGIALNDKELIESAVNWTSESIWIFGVEKVFLQQKNTKFSNSPKSTAFMEAGYYIMKNDKDHIFIDCGPVGLGGRGGHGHNDILSFEAALNGVHLITDCGAYTYTGCFKLRNQFRGTSSHNTPQINGLEINRFIREDYLWDLIPDAQHKVMKWSCDNTVDEFVGEHTGYMRLSPPILVTRKFKLCHRTHFFQIIDDISGDKSKVKIEIPFHIATGVELKEESEGIILKKNNKKFRMIFESQNTFEIKILPTKISFSYGVQEESKKIIINAYEAPFKIKTSLESL